MFESVMSSTPLVPRLDQIQQGYDVPCRTVMVAGGAVRQFWIPDGTQSALSTVVCLPGLGASGRSFALMRPLAADHRLLFWTPPVRTPPRASPLWYNVELLAHPEANLPRRFVLVGSSFGSLIALAFAARYPERLDGLVLASPVASTRRIRRGAMAASTMLRIPLPFAYAFAPLVARVLGGLRLPDEGRAEIVREARRLTPTEMVRRLKDILATDLLPVLDSLEVPTLVVHGGSDVVVGTSAARDVAERLRRGRLEIIKGAAHLPYMSHPETFNALVREFLAEVRQLHHGGHAH